MDGRLLRWALRIIVAGLRRGGAWLLIVDRFRGEASLVEAGDHAIVRCFFLGFFRGGGFFAIAVWVVRK